MATATAAFRCVVGVANIGFGATRVFRIAHEQAKFVEVLLLDEQFLILFGAVQLVCGLLLVANKEVTLALSMAIALQLILVAAAAPQAMHGDDATGVGNQAVIQRLSFGWLGLHLVALGFHWMDRGVRIAPTAVPRRAVAPVSKSSSTSSGTTTTSGTETTRTRDSTSPSTAPARPDGPRLSHGTLRLHGQMLSEASR